MSEDNLQKQPSSRSLDGVLDELRDVLSGVSAASGTSAVPETPIQSENTPPPAESIEELMGTQPAKTTVSFEVIKPEEPPPPLPQAAESSPEACSLLERTKEPDLPPPAVAEEARPSWIRPDAGTDAFAVDQIATPAAPLPEPVEIPVAPSVEEASPFAALIPGEQDSRESLATDEPEPFDLETEKRPEGLIQIACLFPEGDEKKGQSFVNRLKESAGRMKKPITIQPVFLHTWSASSVDLGAWSTSAALSGADAIFILAPRASSPLFGKLAAEAAKAGTSGRMVPLEMLQSPALYADVLVDLSRKAHGTR